MTLTWWMASLTIETAWMNFHARIVNQNLLKNCQTSRKSNSRNTVLTEFGRAAGSGFTIGEGSADQIANECCAGFELSRKR
ncbi:hypothetical protein ACFL3I_12250 [Pseudomonadota bacterium]